MRLRITVEGKAYDVDVEVLDESDGSSASSSSGAPSQAAPPQKTEQPKPTAGKGAAAKPPASSGAGPGQVAAPVAGTVFDVKVKPGDEVKAHDTLLVLEAMKMESNVPAPQAGSVQEVLVSNGDSVTAGQVLVRLG